jgi:di/tricarboxylate transporter
LAQNDAGNEIAASDIGDLFAGHSLMVVGSAGYRFANYWKLGLPTLLLFLMAVFLVPVFWPF